MQFSFNMLKSIDGKMSLLNQTHFKLTQHIYYASLMVRFVTAMQMFTLSKSKLNISYHILRNNLEAEMP